MPLLLQVAKISKWYICRTKKVALSTVSYDDDPSWKTALGLTQVLCCSPPPPITLFSLTCPPSSITLFSLTSPPSSITLFWGSPALLSTRNFVILLGNLWPTNTTAKGASDSDYTTGILAHNRWWDSIIQMYYSLGILLTTVKRFNYSDYIIGIPAHHSQGIHTFSQ